MKHEGSSQLRKLLEAATPGPWMVTSIGNKRGDKSTVVATDDELRYIARCHDLPAHVEHAPTDDTANAALIVHLRNNADKYAGMEERIAELESQLEASLGALREQMKARRDACARLGAVEGGLRIAAIYVRAALQGDGGQE